MQDFLKIYNRLKYLMIEKLPEYIDTWNKEHEQYQFELKQFTNRTLYKNTELLPCFNMLFEEAEQGKKDRIIGTINYKFSFEFYFEKSKTPDYVKIHQMKQILNEMLNDDDFELWRNFEIVKTTPKRIDFIVHVEW